MIMFMKSNYIGDYLVFISLYSFRTGALYSDKSVVAFPGGLDTSIFLLSGGSLETTDQGVFTTLII